jgi:hypothetical protein
MFRKIVSNLSFSPALVGQLGFYARRLKKEETTRRLGLVFVALALVVQSLTVFQPPESANAANSTDFVAGGLGLGSNRSLNNFLAPYDTNATNLRDIMNSVGITRAEIASAQFGKFRTPGKISWGRNPISYASGSVVVNNSAGNAIGSIYGRDITVLNGDTNIYGWIGYSARIGWFAIMQVCGNLVTDYVPGPIVPPPPVKPPTPPPPPVKPPTPPPVTPPVIKKPANIIVSKTATNASQGSVPASTIAAKENDRINYTVHFENTGEVEKVVKIEDLLDDILEYSTLVDKGGGTFTESTKTLSWPDVTLKGGEKQARSFTVQILATIPSTPVGLSSPESFNCVMDNAFTTGGAPVSGIKVPVTCAPPKVIEAIATELPRTGPRENMLFAAIVLAVVTYFFFRSKQLGKEVRLIRRDLNAGTI